MNTDRKPCRPMPDCGAARALLLICLAMPGCLLAQGDLPPAAQQAMKNGLAAAKLSQWVPAVNYFEEAQKAAPRSPQVLFNLALANDKAGGRELIAIARFYDFFAVVPNAKNASQIRERILALEDQVETHVRLLTDMGRQAAEKFMESGVWYLQVIESLIAAGDVQAAERIAEKLTDEKDVRSGAFARIARAYLERGEMDSAAHAAERINPDYWESSAVFVDITEAQAKAGDYSGVRKMLERFSDEIDEFTAPARLSRVAFFTARAGDRERALKIIAEVEPMFRRLPDNDDLLSLTLTMYGQAQAAAGDFEGSRASFSKAHALADRIPTDGFFGAYPKYSRYHTIATYQAEAGDLEGAKLSATSTPEEDWRNGLLGAVASKQAEIGDIAGAIETMRMVTTASDTAWAYRDIIVAQIDRGDSDGAKRSAAALRQALEDLPSDEKHKEQFHRIAEGLATAGDIAGAQRAASRLKEQQLKTREVCWHIGRARALAAARMQPDSATETQACRIGFLAELLGEKDLYSDFPSFLKRVQGLPTLSGGQLAEAANEMRKTLERLRSFRTPPGG